MALGRSQKAVYEWMLANGHAVQAWDVGLALYSTTSTCAKFAMDRKSCVQQERLATSWANRILRSLITLGMVELVSKKSPFRPGRYRAIRMIGP